MSDDTKNEGNDLLNDDTLNEGSDQSESNDQADNQVSGEANSSDGAGQSADDQNANDDQGAPASDEGDVPSQENTAPQTTPEPQVQTPPAPQNVPTPTPARTTEKDIGISYQKMTQDMKEHLASQPKVHFMIPLGEGEKDGAYETVQINGYKMTIKKGTMVVIPQQVAEILADHYRITSEVGQDMRIDRDDRTATALS